MSFKKEIESIEIPKQLSKRSKEGIYLAQKEHKKKNFRKYYQGLAAAAVMGIVIIFASDASLATSIKGFFANLTNWNGAIIGTTYENATDEIVVTAENIENEEYLLTVSFNNKDKVPFSITELLEMGEYQFFNDGKKINIESAFVNDVIDTGNLIIDDKELLFHTNENNYKKVMIINGEVDELVIKSFFIHSAGDAPLEVKGEWRILFNSNN